MYSDRNVTSRPRHLIVILGIKFFLSFFLDKVMGSRLYMYIVVRHIVKDVSHSSLCARRFSERRPVPTTKFKTTKLSFRGGSVIHGRQLCCSGIGRKPYSSCS